MKIFIGFDQREAVAYHVCCQSIIERASIPVSFHPLAKGMLSGFDRSGSNAFTYSRYLIPYLNNFVGWALYIDGDMVVDCNIAQMLELQREHFDKAAVVVKHDYQTRHARKYIGSTMESVNEHYPRKNWSSVILWNCAHFANRCLMPEYVQEAKPSFLHRFEWLKDEQLGELPAWWNHLVGEYPPESPSLYHYTLGIPGIKYYADISGSWKWHSSLVRALECAGESPSVMVQRAEDRVGELRELR